ncbi:MAG: hypothetical protein M3O71_11175 [Bacteroidota bacterium]|nr:hypothetical protein [Bacteroidota bacterium]
MEEIYKNDDLLQLIWGSYHIHDSSVNRFDIYQRNYQLCIDVYFDSTKKPHKQLKIHFSGIIKYQFLYNESYHFYNVESYKFFKSGKGYYISLDPFDESQEMSEEDGDLILCKEIEACFI